MTFFEKDINALEADLQWLVNMSFSEASIKEGLSVAVVTKDSSIIESKLVEIIW